MVKCLECRNYWTNGKDEACDVRGWDFTENCPDFRDKAKPVTHYELLVSKTPEELAMWLADVAGWLPQFEGRVHPILEWLEQEVDE